MPIITDGPALEPVNKGIDEFHVGRLESLGAAAVEAVTAAPVVQLIRGQEIDRVARGDTDYSLSDTGVLSTGPDLAEVTAPAIPRIDIMDANHRVKQAGLPSHLIKLPDQPDIPAAQLEIMMARATARREREVTMERGPGGFIQGALEVGTSFLVGAVDPLNLATAFIPVMGELRYAKLLASAGESVAARAGVRAAVGAAGGAVGQALIEPIDWWSHTQDGRDFGMADVLHNILFGAVLGGTLHSGGGAISDAWRARKGRPMYPYDLGEAMEFHTPWDELRARPAAAAPRLGEFPGIHDPIFSEAPDQRVTPATLAAEAEAARPTIPSEAVQTINDLPQRAREDAARIGIANLIEGEPLRVGEALEAAARGDPRIAESFDAHVRNEPLTAAAAREAVFDDVHQQLLGAGLTEDEAGYNAAIVAARYATRAQRLGDGRTAADLYRAEGINIRSGEFDDAEGRAFAQRRSPGPDLFAAREADGQTSLPGTERIGQGELAQRRADEALKPKVAQKPADEGLFGDSAAQKSFFQSRPTAPTFYSAVDRAITAAKQDKASPEQWLGMLKNAAGVKAEEMKWLGLEDWLKEQKGTVTKDRVQAFIRANQIEVKEVGKGGETFENTRPDEVATAEHGPEWERLVAKRRKIVGPDLANELRLPADQQRAVQEIDRQLDALHDRMVRETVDRAGGEQGPTRYQQYRLPGGENYRELLLTLPEKDTVTREPVAVPAGWGDTDGGNVGFVERGNTGADYRSSHWEEPNVLAHVRFDDRISDGKKTLHVAEVQSDWHQAGKRKGYQGEDVATEPRFVASSYRTENGLRYRVQDLEGTQGKAGYLNEEDAVEAAKGLNAREQEARMRRGVPQAPFKTSWPELAMKRMIRYAAERGYERISWDTGITNAERYDLSQQIKRVTLEDNSSGGIGRPRMDGPFSGGMLTAYDHNGREVLSKYVNDPAELPDLIGKEAADKLMNVVPIEGRSAGFGVRERKLEGLDLKVGGEGMKGFYDKILPATVNKLVKKFGAKVESARLENVIDHDLIDAGTTAQDLGRSAPIHAVDITPELRTAAVEEGFPLFQGGEASPRGRITLAENAAIIDLFKAADRSTFMHESGHLWLDELMRDASHKDAPEQLRADRDAVLKWLGVKDASEIGTAHHEKWAEGFEQYLATGEAPSNVLARAFEQFKQWMLEIYRAIAGARQEISPEIRAVMDRLLATDAEIAERQAGRTPTQGEAPVVARSVPAPAKRGRAGADPQTWSLFEYLASRGGLKPDADLLSTFGNNRGPFVPGFGPLLRKTGMTMDEALTAAKEGGYFLDPTSQEHVRMADADMTALDQAPTFGLRDLMEKIDEESRGRKQYREGHVQEKRADREEEAHYIIRALYDELEASSGQKGITVDPAIEKRVVEIVQKEGERDVLAAHERAIMEDEERYNAISEARHADPRDSAIPGWDVRDDAGPASAPGGTAAATGGEAGRAGQGPRGDAGDQPRAAGAGDRAPAEAQLASNLDRDVAWRALSHDTPEFDEPAVIAASNAAAEVKRPPSKLDERLTAAEKADADAKQMYDMFAERLPEEDRLRLDDLIKTIESDHEARSIAIERGAACLFGARE